MISFGELLVVVFMIFIFLKPDDLPILLKNIKKFRKMYIKLSNDLHNIIDEDEDVIEIEKQKKNNE